MGSAFRLASGRLAAQVKRTGTQDTANLEREGKRSMAVDSLAQEGTLRQRLTEAGQAHLLEGWSELSEAARRELAAEIAELDFDLLARLMRGHGPTEDWAALSQRATSPPAIRLGQAHPQFTRPEAEAAACRLLDAGRLGVVLVAGGQGTRLGFPQPKGMFPIGPVSGASLFQILCEKVVALSRRHRVRLPLYLMTSPATHEETVAYLAARDRFGLAEEDLHIFCQGTMPAVDEATGRVLLEAPGRVARSPDGHGGMLAALVRGGLLEAMRSRGIEQLFYLQVDNPLARIGAPDFLGYHLLAGSEMSTMVVAKRTPADRVGNVASIDGQVRVIEYSDLPAEAAERRADDGSLVLWAGNTAIHLISTAFLDRMAHQADSLPFHLARKKVPYWSQGKLVESERPNAIKFERFIFDLLPQAAGALVVEVDEATDFAPVKNAPGEARDTPELVQRQMVALHTAWLAAAGVAVDPGTPVEISPRFALDPEELAPKVAGAPRVSEATYFC